MDAFKLEKRFIGYEDLREESKGKESGVLNLRSMGRV